jgi:hypothetical protein
MSDAIQEESVRLSIRRRPVIRAAILTAAVAAGLPVVSATVAASPAQAATVSYPSSPFTDWEAEPHSQPLTTLDQDMQVRLTGDGIFYAAFFGFANDSHSYIGLQTDSDLQPSRDRAIWSVWNPLGHRRAPTALGPPDQVWNECPDPDPTNLTEGFNRSCLAPQTIDPTHVYRMHVELMRNADGTPRREERTVIGSNPPRLAWGTWWHGEVRDLTTGAVTDMGDVLVTDNENGPATGLNGRVGNFVEYYKNNVGEARPCRARPLVAVDLSPPQYNSRTIDSVVAPNNATMIPDWCWNMAKTEDTVTGIVRMRSQPAGYTNTSTWALGTSSSVTTLDTDVTVRERSVEAAAARNELTLSTGTSTTALSRVQLGIETGYSYPDGRSSPDRAVFSVPGGTGIGDANCRGLAHDATGIACRTPYAVQAGRTYRLRLQRQTIGGLTTWVATVFDRSVAGDPGTVVGRARVSGATRITAARSLVTIFGNRQSCDAFGALEVDFARPGINPGATGAYARRASFGTSSRTDCTAGNTTQIGSATSSTAVLRSRVGGHRPDATLPWTGTQDAGAGTVVTEQDVTLATRAAGSNLNLHWTWAGVTNPHTGEPYGGEIGIQANAILKDGTRGDMAYVAVDVDSVFPWGESRVEGPEGPAVGCVQGGIDETSSANVTCLRPVTLASGKTYRLRMTRLAPTDTTQPWRAEVINVTDSVTILDAVVITHAHSQAMTELRNTAVYSGTTLPCASVPSATYNLAAPRFNGGPPLPVGPYRIWGTADCPSPTISQPTPTRPTWQVVTEG